MRRSDLVRRLFKSLQDTCAMIMCWLLFKHGDWFWRNMLNDLFNPVVPGHWDTRPRVTDTIHLLARVVNASFVTGCSLILLIAFDSIADFFETKALDDDDTGMSGDDVVKEIGLEKKGKTCV